MADHEKSDSGLLPIIDTESQPKSMEYYEFAAQIGKFLNLTPTQIALLPWLIDPNKLRYKQIATNTRLTTREIAPIELQIINKLRSKTGLEVTKKNITVMLPTILARIRELTDEPQSRE